VCIERPVHYSESVVDVTMRWARWPEEFRHGNYLTVKPAAVYNEIEQVVCVIDSVHHTQPQSCFGLKLFFIPVLRILRNWEHVC